MNLRRVIAVGGFSTLAFGHPNEFLQPHDLARAWSFDPGVVIPVLLTGALFLRGARASRGVSGVEFLCFWAGWFVLAIALVSPLHPLGEKLFCAHMAQHELLMVVAAPLLIVSRPLVPLLWGLPLAWRKMLGQTAKTKVPQKIWCFLTEPLNAFLIHFAAVWGWHLPALFEATLKSEWIHAAQHVSFFASALLFWWSLLYARSRASYGASVLYIFITAVHTSILGALLTFAQTVWYPAYLTTTLAWGLTPIEDQQAGGLIMWIPAGVVYLAAGLWIFALWLRESDLAAKGREYAR